MLDVRDVGFHRGGMKGEDVHAQALWVCVWFRAAVETAACLSCARRVWERGGRSQDKQGHLVFVRQPWPRYKEMPTPWIHTALAYLFVGACLVGVSCPAQQEAGGVSLGSEFRSVVLVK